MAEFDVLKFLVGVLFGPKLKAPTYFDELL